MMEEGWGCTAGEGGLAMCNTGIGPGPLSRGILMSMRPGCGNRRTMGGRMIGMRDSGRRWRGKAKRRGRGRGGIEGQGCLRRTWG